eukprot:6201708-Pleurochrysis_carterae.AAC.2
MQLKLEEKWRAGVETPPFAADIASAVDFLKAVLDSAVGTAIGCGGKARFCAACWPECRIHSARFLYFKVGVPAPSKGSLRRSSNIMTRKTVGKGAAGKRAGGLV